MTADAALLAIPAALALGLLAWLAAQRRLLHRPLRNPRVPGYELVSVLGTGADSVVYLAREPALNRLVRLKRLRPGSPSQHALIAARLGHPNIAHIYTSFEDAGNAYVAGEHIDGPSLRRVVQQAGPLRAEQAIEAVCDALEGLGYAHAHGLSHGALTPENVIVDEQGLSRLVDFGQRGPATPRDDVTAAAGLLDELFEGRPPGDVAEAILQARADGSATATPSAEEFLRAVEKAAAASYGANWRSRSSLAGPVLVTVSTGAAGPARALGNLFPTRSRLHYGRPLQKLLGQALAAKSIAVLAILLLVAVAPALAYRRGLLPRLRAPSPTSSATATRSMLLPFSPPPSRSATPPTAPAPSPAEPGGPQSGADGGGPASPGTAVGLKPTGNGTPAPTSPPSTPSPTPPPTTSTPGSTPTPTPTTTPTPVPTPTPTPTASPSPTPTPTPTATPTPMPSSTLTPTPTPS